MDKLTPDEQQFILEAVTAFENPDRFMKAVNYLGKPIELGLQKLPEKARTALANGTKVALSKALETAVRTLAPETALEFEHSEAAVEQSKLLHTIGAALTGAVGGTFGYAGLIIELPITTTVMLRSIADIAQKHGFDPASAEVQFECLSIFAMGSPSKSDDAAETSYYAARAALTRLVQEAVSFAANKTARQIAEAVAQGSAPVLVRLIATVASRFEVLVTQKAVIEAIPLVGAVTGAGVNAIFSNHFATVAKYHFGLKRLERKYGKERIAEVYQAQSRAAGGKAASGA